MVALALLSRPPERLAPMLGANAHLHLPRTLSVTSHTLCRHPLPWCVSLAGFECQNGTFEMPASHLTLFARNSFFLLTMTLSSSDPLPDLIGTLWTRPANTAVSSGKTVAVNIFLGSPAPKPTCTNNGPQDGLSASHPPPRLRSLCHRSPRQPGRRLHQGHPWLSQGSPPAPCRSRPTTATSLCTLWARCCALSLM